MKKILWTLGLLLLLFLILVYSSLSSTDKVFATTEIVGIESPDNYDFQGEDSILVIASTLYQANGLKRFMQGTQYRNAWSTPITAPIIHLDTLMGGMTILEEGGGKQTHSLKLKSEEGILYTLRSINKDPDALIPEMARTLGLENIVVDGISAQHPYGAITAAALAEKAQVPHTHPRVVFLPKETALGTFQSKFGNRLFLLEYETEGPVNWTRYPDVSELLDTEDLIELKMELGDSLAIDEKTLVRARLFDLLIGDWDRHAKQWGWAIQKTPDGYLAHPIAGDRDNAFFHIEGILPTLISNRFLLPGLQPFEREIEYLSGLVMPFDSYFLRKTPETVFIQEAEALQNSLDDMAIDKALRQWPKEIYALDGPGIAEKIRTRRDNLVDHAARFHEIIQERELLREPLEGVDADELPDSLIRCFECL